MTKALEKKHKEDKEESSEKKICRGSSRQECESSNPIQ